MLLRNKLDLNDERQVSFSEGTKFAEDHGLVFMETSAKENINISETFEYIAIRMLIKFLNEKLGPKIQS